MGAPKRGDGMLLPPEPAGAPRGRRSGLQRLLPSRVASLAALAAAVVVAVAIAVLVRADNRSDGTVGATAPSDTTPSVTTEPRTSASTPATATSVATTTVPPAVTSTQPVPPGPAGRAAAATCDEAGFAVYACPIRQSNLTDLRPSGVALRGLSPNTYYEYAQCVATANPQVSDCGPRVNGAGSEIVYAEADGRGGTVNPFALGLRRRLLVGGAVVDCVVVQCELRLVPTDRRGGFGTPLRQPLVFADEALPEIQTEDLVQLRHAEPSEVVVPTRPLDAIRPMALVNVCARFPVGHVASVSPFGRATCEPLDTELIAAGPSETRARFWPSRWALASFGIDCSTPGVCWLEIGATGSVADPYGRPVVIGGANEPPAMTVTPPGPYTDKQLVRVQLRNLEPRRFGILSLCLDPVRAAAIVDTGSGDGISGGCMELASLGSTPIGEWPPSAEFIDVSLPRRLVDANGDSHDCMELPGCRLSVGWGTTTYLSSGLRSIEISFTE